MRLLFKITMQKDVTALKSLNSQQTQQSEGSLCYCLLTGHWATGICLKSIGKSAPEARTRARPSVASMGPSSNWFPWLSLFLSMSLPEPRMHSHHVPTLPKAVCQMGARSPVLQRTARHLVCLPSCFSQIEIAGKKFKPAYTDPSKSKYFTKLTAFRWNFVLKLNKQTKRSGSIKTSCFSVFRRKKIFLFYSEKAFHCWDCFRK